MADVKLSDKLPYSLPIDSNDILPILDISDVSESPTWKIKQITYQNLTAPLAKLSGWNTFSWNQIVNWRLDAINPSSSTVASFQFWWADASFVQFTWTGWNNFIWRKNWTFVVQTPANSNSDKLIIRDNWDSEFSNQLKVWQSITTWWAEALTLLAWHHGLVFPNEKSLIFWWDTSPAIFHAMNLKLNTAWNWEYLSDGPWLVTAELADGSFVTFNAVSGLAWQTATLIERFKVDETSATIAGNDITTSSNIATTIQADSPAIVSWYVINTLADLQATSTETLDEFILEFWKQYIFNDKIDLWTKKLNTNGASLRASVSKNWVATSWTELIKSVDVNVDIWEGFFLDWNANCQIFNCTNPVNKRNSFICKWIIQNNNAKSDIVDFQEVMFTWNALSCNESIEIWTASAKKIEFLTFSTDNTDNPITATNFISIPDEKAGLIIRILGCTHNIPSWKTLYNINNNLWSAETINISWNIFIWQWEPIAWFNPEQDNVESKGNSWRNTIEDTRLVWEVIFNNVWWVVTPVTQNVYTKISWNHILKTSTQVWVWQAIDGSFNGIVEVTRPVKNLNVTVSVVLSADANWNGERECQVRLIKNNWSDIILDEWVVFTTRQKGETVSFSTTTKVNQWDKIFAEITNRDSSDDIRVKSSRITIIE